MENIENVIESQAIKCSGNLSKENRSKSDYPLPVEVIVLIYNTGRTNVLCPWYLKEFEGQFNAKTGDLKSTCILHPVNDSYLCHYKKSKD